MTVTVTGWGVDQKNVKGLEGLPASSLSCSRLLSFLLLLPFHFRGLLLLLPFHFRFRFLAFVASF